MGARWQVVNNRSRTAGSIYCSGRNCHHLRSDRGHSHLWDESWQVGLLWAGAIAYVAYFYISRAEAQRFRPLLPKDAERIVRAYGAALSRGSPDRGIARYDSYLPCSKDEIKQAVKLWLAFQIELGSLTKEPTENLLGAISFLNSFVPDEEAERINRSNGSLENEEYWYFVENMVSSEIREEIDDFIKEVMMLDPVDALFHQKVYTLIGIPYSTSIEKQYFSET